MKLRAWMLRSLTLGLFLAVLAGLAASAQDASEKASDSSKKEPSNQEPSKKDAKDTPAPKVDARGFVEMGTVRFNKDKKILEADGTFNMRAGYLEFLACAPGVKSHETLIALDVKPVDLNVGFILLGLEEAPDPAHNDDVRFLKGDRVVVFLRWETVDEEGKKTLHEKRLEDCVFNAIVEESMEKVGLVYTGSIEIDTNPPPLHLTREEVKEWQKKNKPKMEFAPTVTGIYFSLVHEPLCMLNNPLELPYAQGDYYADPDVLPPVDRDNPVKVTMIFRKPKEGEIDYSIRRMKVPPMPEEEEQE